MSAEADAPDAAELSDTLMPPTDFYADLPTTPRTTPRPACHLREKISTLTPVSEIDDGQPPPRP